MSGRGSHPFRPYGRPLAAPAIRAAEPPALAPEGEAAADEAGLWRRWIDRADGQARDALVLRYVPYARAVAAKMYARRRNDEIEFDEYRQLAMVGLLESIDRYLPDRGARFTTFAMPRIRGAILNGLERLTERQQQLAFRRRVLAERTASLVPEAFSPDPTRRLLAELEAIGVGVALGFLLEGTGMVADPGRALPDGAYAQVELRQVHEQLWAMVDRLEEREREIIELHYRRLTRFEEIAEMLHLSKGRVSQLHRQAVMRLRDLISKAERCDVAY